MQWLVGHGDLEDSDEDSRSDDSKEAGPFLLNVSLALVLVVCLSLVIYRELLSTCMYTSETNIVIYVWMELEPIPL